MNHQWPVLLLLLASVAAAAPDQPIHVDLSSVANRALEDDGVAGNEKGGWSDEGANDMFIHPAIEFGKVERNGHLFHLPEPTEDKPDTIVMLRGEVLADLPSQVTVDVPGAKGRYIYFLQNMVHTPDGLDDNAVVARYTIQYEDDSTVTIELEAGQHLRHWWTVNWFDNSGPDSWPVFVGRNAYSVRWNRYIGVWAMRWTNPHPDRAITAITLASTNKASPAVFAITLNDRDTHADDDELRADFNRPPDVPMGYFDGKLATERERIFDEMVKQGMVRGVRDVELIRPDLLAITLDAWVARGPGSGEDNAAALQTPDAFTIQVNDDPATHPTQVGRKTYEYWNGDIGTTEQILIYRHTYYLQFEQPLPAGATCRILVNGIEEPFTATATLAFNPEELVTPTIKVNQVAYADTAKRRYAYLGWWAADLGPVNYDAFKTFRVIDRNTGGVAHEGGLALRAADDRLSGERVYEMDLSALPRGEYHIVVDGLARSSGFAVGGRGITELYKQTNRAYYHQRAGTRLVEPHTPFTTGYHHHRMTRDGRVVAEGEETDEPTRTYRGGYHDAADFDVFTYHLRATAQTLGAYEMHPNAFRDGDLNIPESGNGIPDMLDEAAWALLAYVELQQEDGAVPLGRGNAQDYQRDFVREHGEAPPYGILPASTASSAEYAAVAAQYARVIRPYDADRAAASLASSRKAFAWAQAHPEVGSGAGKLLRTWAAAELFCTTGDEADHQVFKELYEDGGYDGVHWSLMQYLPTFMQSYALSERDNLDPDIKRALRATLLRMADDHLKNTDKPAYRVGFGTRDSGAGWGSLNGGGRYGGPLLLAHHLTGEQRYLDAASLNADFQLGCNPLSKTFITGMGDRPPLHPQIAAYLYTGPNKTGEPVQGITIYGLASREPAWYPKEIPAWRRWRDLGNGSAEISSEFTITETIGASSMLYSILHALQQ